MTKLRVKDGGVGQGGGGGGGGRTEAGRDTESKTRTPHKGVGNRYRYSTLFTIHYTKLH